MFSAGLREDLTCSVCMEIYNDPVTLPCGHNFCRECITRTWDNQDEGESTCPECIRRYKRQPELTRNIRLASLCDNFQQSWRQTWSGSRITCSHCLDSPRPAVKSCVTCEVSLCDKHVRAHSNSAGHFFIQPTTSFSLRKCLVHKKTLEFYCTEDGAYVCVYCRLDGDHGGHQMESLDVASEKKKKKLRYVLEKLSLKKEEINKRIERLEKYRTEVMGKAASETQRVTLLFRNIRRQMNNLEKRVLSDISRQEEQILNSATGLIRQLIKNKNDLCSKIYEIQELCNVADPVRVLIDQKLDPNDFSDSEGDHSEDKESQDEDFCTTGDLDEGLISQAVHMGLADIVDNVERGFDAQKSPEILLDFNTTSEDVVKTGDSKSNSVFATCLSRFRNLKIAPSANQKTSPSVSPPSNPQIRSPALDGAQTEEDG